MEERIPILKYKKRVRTIQDAKAILSKLISAFMKGEIDNKDAKDLCYLLNTYVAIHRDTDLEERIEQLENRSLNYVA